MNLSCLITLRALNIEALLVDYFLYEFERKVQSLGLNMEERWHDLLDTCFKKTRTKDMKLYSWFTKQFFDDRQSWSQAKSIIKRYFGFDCPLIKQEIRKALTSFKKLPGESYTACCDRFHPIALACKKIKLVESDDSDLILKIMLCASDTIKQQYFANSIKAMVLIREQDKKTKVDLCFDVKFK